MKFFKIFFLALALVTGFASCNKVEPVVDERTQLMESLVGTRWTYESNIATLKLFFLKDGRISSQCRVGANYDLVLEDRSTYDIQIIDGEAWLDTKFCVDQITPSSAHGKYALDANKITFEIDGDPNRTVTVVLRN